MPRYFTHYWRNTTWNDYYDNLNLQGELLDHTADNKFRERGAAAGDVAYVVTVFQGTLYLLGKMEIRAICGTDEAERLLGYRVWDADDHLIAARATPMDFTRAVALETTEALRFRGDKPLFFETPGQLDKQTLRGVRELSAESAALLDAQLPALEPVALPRPGRDDGNEEQPTISIFVEDDEETFPEGRERFRQHRYRERNSALIERVKRARLAHDPLVRCQICGFSFVETYGDQGAGFIEAHHILPVSEMDGVSETRMEDIILLCSNCHRMIHRRRPWLTIERITELVQ